MSKSFLDKIKEEFLNILFPKTCFGCGKEGKYICDDCEVFLGEAASVQVDYSTKHGLDGLVSVWEHEGIAKEALYRIKHQLISDAIPEFLKKSFLVMRRDISRFESFLSFLFSEDVYITYVPMHIKKEKRKGFNQSEIIARGLGKMIDKEAINLLNKVKITLSQDNLNEEKRVESVKDSFEISSSLPLPSKVVLVDDVWTTGATMRECCGVLKGAGVKKVWGFTLFRDT